MPTAPSVEVPRWVPQNVLQQVYDNPDLMSALKTVSREIASMDMDDSQLDTGSVAETDIGQLFADRMQDDTSHDPITETLQPRIISDSQMANPQQLENETAVVERQPLVTCKIKLNESALEQILEGLQKDASTKKNWLDTSKDVENNRKCC